MNAIQLKEPCKANWNKMKPVEGGRYCDICSKNVIDYSKWETSAIIQDIENRDEKICGRFRDDSIAKEGKLYSLMQSKNQVLFLMASFLIFIIASCRRPIRHTGEPSKNGQGYYCSHKSTKFLDYNRDSNINIIPDIMDSVNDGLDN